MIDLDYGISRILHRDLKPQNIFLATVSPNSNKYICKIGDFGLSRNLGPESFAHSCVGTPYYWSPELLLSDNKKYDDRVDIWALGCVLYEFSCGHTPFHEATTLSELAQKVKEGAPLPISGYVASKYINDVAFRSPVFVTRYTQLHKLLYIYCSICCINGRLLAKYLLIICKCLIFIPYVNKAK